MRLPNHYVLQKNVIQTRVDETLNIVEVLAKLLDICTLPHLKPKCIVFSGITRGWSPQSAPLLVTVHVLLVQQNFQSMQF